MRHYIITILVFLLFFLAGFGIGQFLQAQMSDGQPQDLFPADELTQAPYCTSDSDCAPEPVCNPTACKNTALIDVASIPTSCPASDNPEVLTSADQCSCQAGICINTLALRL